MAIHDRILSVLGAFSGDRPSLSLSDIARATDLPIGTTHRIVGQLVQWGALERDERRRYVVGLKLFEIGALAPRAYRHRDRIFPFLEELFAATRENVMFTILDGHEAVMVEHVVGHRAIPIAAGLGERLPLHASAAGHVMLAFGPPDLLAFVLERPLAAYTRHTVTDPAALRAAVSEVRRTRIAVSRSAIDLQAISIAAPVFAERGAFAGAVSIVTTVETTDVTAFAPAVARAAQRISAALEIPEPRPPYRPLRRGRVRGTGARAVS